MIENGFRAGPARSEAVIEAAGDNADPSLGTEGHRAVFDLGGNVAIVTGGSRGIGAAAATALASAGASVVLVGRDGSAAERVADAINAGGGDAYGMGCDVADYSSVEKIVAETEHRFGAPTILVNNAGVIDPIGPLASSDPVAWRRNIEINLIVGNKIF